MADPKDRLPLDDESLREVYRQAHAGAAGPHLSETEWEHLVCGELDPDAAARAHAHITACTRCADIHRGLNALAEGAVQFDPNAVQTQPPRHASRLLMVVGGLAAAAVIVMAVLVDRQPLQRTAGDEVTRTERPAAVIATVTPGADARLDGRRFEWRPLATADAYEVRINGEDGAAVWSAQTTGTVVALPADRNLVPGRYYWRVTALRENAIIGSSPLIAFRVE